MPRLLAALVASALVPAVAAAQSGPEPLPLGTFTYAGCDALVCVTLTRALSVAPRPDEFGRTVYSSTYGGTVTLRAPWPGGSRPSSVGDEVFFYTTGQTPPTTFWADHGRFSPLAFDAAGTAELRGTQGYTDLPGPPPGRPTSVRGTLFDVGGASARYDVSLTTTPEPSTFALAAAGGLALWGAARRRKA